MSNTNGNSNKKKNSKERQSVAGSRRYCNYNIINIAIIIIIIITLIIRSAVSNGSSTLSKRLNIDNNVKTPNNATNDDNDEYKKFLEEKNAFFSSLVLPQGLMQRPIVQEKKDTNFTVKVLELFSLVLVLVKVSILSS